MWNDSILILRNEANSSLVTQWSARKEGRVRFRSVLPDATISTMHNADFSELQHKLGAPRLRILLISFEANWRMSTLNGKCLRRDKNKLVEQGDVQMNFGVHRNEAFPLGRLN